MGKGSSCFNAQSYPRQPFLLSVDEVLRHLGTDQDLGLSSAQVQQYRRKYGENEIEGERGVKWYSLLMKQVSNAMILVGPLYV
jgi:P-type Na+/K+ transporter